MPWKESFVDVSVVKRLDVSTFERCCIDSGVSVDVDVDRVIDFFDDVDEVGGIPGVVSVLDDAGFVDCVGGNVVVGVDVKIFDDSDEGSLPSDSLRLLLRLLLPEVVVEVVEGLRALAVDVAVVVAHKVLLKVAEVIRPVRIRTQHL